MPRLSHIEVAKQSARGSLYLFMGSFLSTAILAVATIIIARLLGPGEYGVYTLVLLIPSIFQTLLGLGVGAAITRYTAYYAAQGKRSVAERYVLNGSLFLVLFGVGLTLVSVFGARYLAQTVLHREALAPLIEYTSIIILAQTALAASVAALMGWNSMGLASLSSITQAIVRLSVAPALILLGFGVFGALVGHIVSLVLAAAVATLALYFYKLRGVAREGGSFFKDVREMVSYSLPIYTGSVVFGLSTQYVTVILANIAVNAVVGYYQAAYNVLVAISLTSSAVSQALFPAFSSLEGIKMDLGPAFDYSVRYLSFIVAPTILFLVGAADLIVRILYGPSFSAAGFYLQLLALSNLPIVLGLSVVGVLFNGAGKTRLTMVVNLLGSSVLVVFASLLGGVLGFGVVGLIYSALISNSVSVAVGLYLALRFLRARVGFRSLAAMLAASVVAYAAILPTSLLAIPAVAALLVDLLVFLVVYLTAAPLLRALDLADIGRLYIAIGDLGIVARLLRPILRYVSLVLRLAGGGAGVAG